MAPPVAVQVRLRRKRLAVTGWESAAVDWRDAQALRKVLHAGMRRRGWAPGEWAHQWEIEVRRADNHERLTVLGGV